MYEKKRFAIDNLDWTAISSAHGVQSFALRSVTGTAFLLRTNRDDPSTEDTVGAGRQEEVSADASHHVRNDGEILVYAKSTVASDTLVASFVPPFLKG